MSMTMEQQIAEIERDIENIIHYDRVVSQIAVYEEMLHANNKPIQQHMVQALFARGYRKEI